MHLTPHVCADQLGLNQVRVKHRDQTHFVDRAQIELTNCPGLTLVHFSSQLEPFYH
jgi:hypothetical protein